MAKRLALRYSRWDGSQVGFEMNADDVFGEITDDLLYHGDLNAALRRMMQSGFQDRNGEQLKGLREMLEELRRRRGELEQLRPGWRLRRHRPRTPRRRGPGAPPTHSTRWVRAARGRRGGRPAAPGDHRPGRAGTAAATRHAVAGSSRQVRDLQDYEFTSCEARAKFDELLEQLRQQLTQSYVNQMAGAMSKVSPEEMERMKDMMSEP